MQYLGRNSKDLKTMNSLYAEYACNKVAELVKKKLDEFIRAYYREYSPIQYMRTWTFLNSVIKTKAEKVGDEWVATVYIDTSLEYPSMWNGQHWTVGDTAYFANMSKHGDRQVSDMRFFDDAYDEILNDEHLTSSLVSFLKQNGIEIKYERF